MRKYDVAYVPNGPTNYYPAKALEDMSLEEIVKKYIRTCGKANGNVAICSQCKSPCKEGKRAIQLLANKVYNDPPIPLYGGKTLIERAKEENMKRREKNNMVALADALEQAKKEALEKDRKQERPIVKDKSGNIRWDGWWEESLASGDQIKWLIDNMKLSKSQAKAKIYHYKYDHGLINKKEKVEVKKETPKPVEQPVVTSEVKESENKIETKIELLMRKQEEYKQEMDKYMKLYNEAKKKYDDIKSKVDTLCSAMDIINE